MSTGQSAAVDVAAPASRREQILAHAGALFAAHGVRAVTTRQIAAAVGISQPSLYAFFPSRDAIAVALCCRAFGDLRARLAAAAQAAGLPRQRFAAMARAYIDFGLQQPTAYRVAFMADLPDHTRAQRDDVVAAGVDAFALLRALVAETHDEADAAAQSAWAGLHGLVALLLARPDFPWVAREALIARHIAGLSVALYGAA